MTKIIAHRGARSIAPENSIVAAETARKIGADLWETDVSVTQDGSLILFHDNDLLRTTNAKEAFPNSKSFNLYDFDLAQIKTLDIGTVFIEKDPFGQIASGNISLESIESFKGEKIPTLEEAMLYTQKTEWAINIELKEQGGKLRDFPLPQKVIDLICSLKIDNRLVIISSFNHGWLQQVNNLMPEIEVQALIGDNVDTHIKRSESFNSCFGSTLLDFKTYNINSNMISIDEIVRLKDMGKKINLFTVNDKEEMVMYIKAGVDGIFTDYPQVMKRLLTS